MKNKQQINNFTFYENYTRILYELPTEIRAELALAIIEYGSGGEEPKFDNQLLRIAWHGVKLSLRTSRNRANSPRVESPKQNKNKTKTNDKQNQNKVKTKSKQPLSEEIEIEIERKENIKRKVAVATAQPLRGIAKSLFDDLSVEKMQEIALKKRIEPKIVEEMKEKYINWVNQKKTDKNRQNRTMSATVMAWITRGLEEGKIRRIEVLPEIRKPEKSRPATLEELAAWQKTRNQLARKFRGL